MVRTHRTRSRHADGLIHTGDGFDYRRLLFPDATRSVSSLALLRFLAPLIGYQTARDALLFIFLTVDSLREIPARQNTDQMSGGS